MKNAIILVALLALAACSTLSKVNEHDLALRIGVAEYIGSDAQVAQRVIAFAEEAQTKLDGRIMVPVISLQAEADRMIPWERLSPGQRILAQELFTHIEDRIVSGPQVDSAALEDLRSILAKVQAAAETELRYTQAR